MEQAFSKKISKWGGSSRTIIPIEGKKYGSDDDSQKVFNPILGIVTVMELKKAEIDGVAFYQDGSWKIPVEPAINSANGMPTVRVSSRYLNWKTQRDKRLMAHPVTRKVYDMLPGAHIE